MVYGVFVLLDRPDVVVNTGVLVTPVVGFIDMVVARIDAD